MHRPMGNASLMDGLLPEKVGRNAPLEQLDTVLDWDRLAAVVADLYAAPEGRPSYPPLLMVKVLLLQQWYTASDPPLRGCRHRRRPPFAADRPPSATHAEVTQRSPQGRGKERRPVDGGVQGRRWCGMWVVRKILIVTVSTGRWRRRRPGMRAWRGFAVDAGGSSVEFCKGGRIPNAGPSRSVGRVQGSSYWRNRWLQKRNDLPDWKGPTTTLRRMPT